MSTTAITPSQSACEENNYKVLRICCWLVLLSLGAAQAWTTRFTMNPDGVSYLDIGDAYWRGDWHNAINAYWSPLYSWILGFFLKVLRPSVYWEYPVVHLVNFIIYIFALTCFDLFLSTFIVQQTQRCNNHFEEMGIPEWGWRVLGYALFLWSSITLVPISIINPDLFVYAFFFLDCALLLRLRKQPTAPNFTLLGISLGFGFLAKSILFPLGFAFLFAAAVYTKPARRVFVGGLVFLAISAPFIITISQATHRLTFGDSGRFTYAGCIDGVEPWFPGDGGNFDCRGIGHASNVDQPSLQAMALLHPVKKIFEKPATYFFDGPVKGTYPFWYDISYWQDGIKPHFEFRAEARCVRDSLLLYLALLAAPQLQLTTTAGFLLMCLLAPKSSQCFRVPSEYRPLLMPTGAAVLMYMVVHSEFRYTAPMVCLTWILLFSGIRLPSSKSLKVLVATIVIMIAAQQTGSTLAFLVRSRSWFSDDIVFARAAQALKSNGFGGGDAIAMISDKPLDKGGPNVARLARVRIVAQVNDPPAFFNATESRQLAVLQALSTTGARAVLSWTEKPLVREHDWRQLGDTNYFIYALQEGGR